MKEEEKGMKGGIYMELEERSGEACDVIANSSAGQ
jgi:hypothetical protein